MSNNNPSYSKHDPFAEREAQNYENPVPSREYILEFLASQAKPMNFMPLVEGIGIDPADEARVDAISNRLKAMLRDGQLMKNRRGAFALIEKMNLLKGTVIGHPEGYGFVTCEGEEDDLYLSAFEMRKVLHGDEVFVSVIGEDKRGRKEAAIVEVTKRNYDQLVGRVHFVEGLAWVQPNNTRITQDIFVPADGLMGAEEEQLVLVNILMQPSSRHGPVGCIAEVLGDYMDPGLETDVAIRDFGLPHIWPDALVAELDTLPDEVLPEELEGRKDLRDLNFVTIDGEDARDFDDAVFAAKRKNGYRLLVAIADVSHYVKTGSELDKEAFNRGNSVYFPNRVLPMLPEKLSNGVCSLNPLVDRLAMICDMSISNEGKLERSQFYRGVIQSKARLTYNQVYDYLSNPKSEIANKYSKIVEHLDDLNGVFTALSFARTGRGALDFETVETRMVFDDSGKIDKIIPVVRNMAHRIIEECMLVANVATARHLQQHKIPMLYRIHEKPKEEKLANFRGFLADFGHELKGGEEPTPQNYAQVLEEVEGKPYAHLVQTLMLRSMNQAMYQPENLGHFGLNYPDYAHFTSPIRRYPDLLIHRAIGHLLDHQPVEKFAYTNDKMTDLGLHASMTERRADEATRDVEAFLKCEFLSHRLGEEYVGTVTAATNFGLFVELEDLYIEGLIHVTELGEDYFIFDKMRHRLKGERTGITYGLGDKVEVQVAQVVVDTRKIDLKLLGKVKEEFVPQEIPETTKKILQEKTKKPTRTGSRSKSDSKEGTAKPKRRVSRRKGTRSEVKRTR